MRTSTFPRGSFVVAAEVATLPGVIENAPELDLAATTTRLEPSGLVVNLARDEFQTGFELGIEIYAGTGSVKTLYRSVYAYTGEANRHALAILRVLTLRAELKQGLRIAYVGDGQQSQGAGSRCAVSRSSGLAPP